MSSKLSKKLVMTLLVRDEQDIIEQCIKFHLAQGVDFIIATDNGSIDNTRNILLKYQKQGVLELIDEPEQNYNQAAWVHRMIILAKKKHKADWIINVDADEFWFSNYGNLKLSLPDKKFNVLYANALQVDPVDCDPFEIPKSLSGRFSGNWKCMHTARGYKMNSMGNHSVMMKRFFRKATTSLDIIIFHFAIRSYNHYEKKILMTMAAFDKNPKFGKNVGAHIRKAYGLYKEGRLREEYENLKTKYINEQNYIKGDSRLYDFINNGYKSLETIAVGFGIYNNQKFNVLKKSGLEKIKNSFSKRFNEIQNAISKRS